METKHTPGPWFVQKEAIKPRVGITAMSGQFITWAMDDGPNAHLIAAAPELLEALRTALGHLLVLSGFQAGDSAPSWFFQQYADLYAVVAKAEGRS